MTSGPIVALALCKVDAIKAWRQMMGPTDSTKARKEAPTSLRALYGTDNTMNACHGSDSPLSAARELNFHFPKLTLEPLTNSEELEEYIKANIAETLNNKALVTLCKEKPSANSTEALTFLANWMLKNNPNKPQMVAGADFPLNPEDEDDELEFLADDKEEAAAEEAAEAEVTEDAIEDLELEAAATKVQASFRGFKAREEVKKKKEAAASEEAKTSEDVMTLKVEAVEVTAAET